jgi:thioesterase domain-containing protein
VQLSNLYGPTEAAIDVTAWECRREERETRVPIGRPIANTQIYILDEHRRPVPIGVEGELYIGGAGVGRGYLNRPQLTAERFVEDPFSADAHSRLYKTGDVGRWRADGSIEYLGRNDAQVKIRGFRIELGEIEARLLEHARVQEAVVLAREDEPGEKRLVAYYTLADKTTAADEEAVSVEALRAHLQTALPEYMVPAAYVQLDRLPLTPNGKVDRRGLPAPEGDAYDHQEYEVPLGYLETVLAQLWRDLLQVDRVGRHDDFFALGGHSLLAVQLVSRIHLRLSVEVSVWKVIHYPTVAKLAMHLFDFVGENSGVLGFRTTGSDRPLFLTHLVNGDVSYGAGIAHELDPQIPVYGLSVQDPAEVGGSIERLADHHIRSMRRIQPHGPYRVAGWSFGGFVAYEIARQLIGQDETVEFIGLLDTPVREPEIKLEMLEGIAPVQAALRDAISRYYQQPIRVTVMFFSAASDADSDPTRGWSALLGCNVRVRKVVGDHVEMMTVYTADLAREISAGIQESMLAQLSP